MVEDNFSCIKEVTKVVHITLPTACTSNEINGISDVLESWKRQYIQQLQAVVVNYKNVSLTSSRGFIKLDYPFILHDVKATFELFYPTVGSIVKGKINRVSHDYIGCLVHNTINVTIDRSNDTSELSHFVALDRFILFEITRLNYKRKIIHVKGKITEECIRLMRESDMITSDMDVSDNGFVSAFPNSDEDCKNDLFSSNLSREMSTDSGHHSPRKKKSKKSYNASPEKSLSPCSTVRNSELEDFTDISSLSSSVKKKKRKKSTHDLLTSPPLFSEQVKQESETSSILSSPPKKKKHKATKQDAIKSQINEITPKSSPKKKHKKSKSEALSTDFKNVDLSLNVKQEVYSDSQNSFTSPKKSNKKLSFPENCTDVYEMMEAFSSFEPLPEAQLLGNETSVTSVKEEPLEVTKVSRKRKHESSSTDRQSKKKRKIKDENSSNKDKEVLNKDKGKKPKKKKKKKEKSKKDKEKKSKLKVISTKKKLHGYENKLKKKTKKKEKSEKTKKKKSVKQKAKDVPSSVSIKSEKN